MAIDRRAAWTFQLRDFWAFYNTEYLNDALRSPTIVLVDSEANLGAWCGETRELSISLRHVAEDPWHRVLGTLRHEMAHQYADEVLGARDEGPHGPAFRRSCERLRVVPRASGGSAAEPDEETERLARRIAKLFALGASTNEHEAASAVRKARRLMVERNVDLVERDAARSFGCLALGEIKARHAAWESELGTLLGEFFFVEPIWAEGYDARRDKRGTVLHVYGTHENLRMAEYVWIYLTRVLSELWEHYRTRARARGAAAKLAYFRGLLQGFRAKLRAQQAELDAEGALVWSGDPRLRTFFRWQHPRVETRTVGARRASDAYRDGCRDGKDIALHRPLDAAQDAGGAGTRLLGG